MPAIPFIDRTNPHSPECVTVSDTRHGPHVDTLVPGKQSRVLCFSETQIAQPLKLNANVRKKLVRLMHERGIHGEYAKLSDNGLVALAHARRLARQAKPSARSPELQAYRQQLQRFSESLR